MRIISGTLKGKKLLNSKDKKTRPLRDLVKESIFNLVEHSNKFQIKVKGSNILDLFSGTGSFGIECLSRGAENVFFIENYNETLKILDKNISNLKLTNQCNIIRKDCFDFLEKSLKKKFFFDIVFLDPPFKELKVNHLIKTILQKKILKEKGIIIIHRHKKDLFNTLEHFKILDQRYYGISKIIIGN